VEQILADASIQDANNNIFDDELMSMWMAAPTDVALVRVGMQTQTGTPTSGRDGWQMAAVVYLKKHPTVLYM
jgi:hypothetical protein